MRPYSKTISKLLEDSSAADPSIIYLSAYFPKKNRNKAELKKHIKSHFFDIFRKQPKLKKDKDLRHKIVQAVQLQVDELENLRQGLAIFVEIALDKLQGKKIEIPQDTVTVLPLNRSPKREVRLEDAYDVDQLVWMNNVAGSALVMSLRGKEAYLYCVDLSGIEPERKEKVPLELEREPEYLEQFSPTNFRELYHGTGADKLSRMREMERERLIRDVKEVIKSPLAPSGYEYLIIFASSGFDTLISNLVDDATVAPAETEVIVERKNIDDEMEIKRLAREKISKNQEERRRQLLERIQEAPEQYAEGWDGVTEAAREGSIAALFIKPDLERAGFVLDRKLPYLEPAAGSRRVNNLAPWLVRRVVQTDGEIAVFRGANDTREVPDLAAFLRYRKG